MFPHNYFAAYMFAERYFAPTGDAPPPAEDGGRVEGPGFLHNLARLMNR